MNTKFPGATLSRVPRIAALSLAVAALTAGCHRNEPAADMNAPASAATMPTPAAETPAPTATTAMPSAMPPAGDASAATSADQAFVGEAMRSNEDEIGLTQLATDKGGAALKSLAQMLHKDHMAMRDKLNAVAQGMSPPSPAAPPADLASATGKDFDKRALTILRDAHESAVAKFTAASNDSALSEDVRTLAKDALPTLQGHLDKVKAALAKE